MQKEQILIAILRAVVCGEELPEQVKTACTDEMLQAVYSDAKRHDLAHLVSYALRKLDLPESEILTDIHRETKQATFRYMRQDIAFSRICDTLEKAQVPFIPLKGAVIRSYYPEPWMRTSGDIDILVKPEDLDRAVPALREMQKCLEVKKGDHDVSFYYADAVHLELHYDTMPEGYVINTSDKVLAQVWEDAIPVRPDAYHHNMSDGMFYFYHFAHWAKHLTNSGCGVRPVLDLWILNHRITPNWEQRRHYLEQGGLQAYAAAMEKLAEVWFSGAESDPMTQSLEEYVLGCNVYGTIERRALQQQRKLGSKFAYAVQRFFLPYDVMKQDFPILRKHKWLLPLYHVIRWVRQMFRGRTMHAIKEMQLIATAPRSQWKTVEDLFTHLGVEEKNTTQE